MLNKEDLWHNLPLSPTVFFVLKSSLTRELFYELLAIFETVGGPPENSISREQFWDAIKERSQGTNRWDTIVPRYTGSTEGDGLIAFHASKNSVENIPKHRAYPSYVVDEIRYVVDLFNPANELELSYRGAGEPVVALMLSNAMSKWVPYPVPVRDRLRDIPSFYRILDGFVTVLEPERVCGGFYIVSAAMAYQHAKEKLPEEVRPWDFLWTLNVFDVARVEGIERSDLDRTFARVLDLSNGQILLQVMPGLDSIMGREYTFASRLLKMTPVTELDL